MKTLRWKLKSPERHVAIHLDPKLDIFVIEAISKLSEGSWRDYFSGITKQLNLIQAFCIRSKFKLKVSTMPLSKEAALMIWQNLGYALLESGAMSFKEYAQVTNDTLINSANRIAFVTSEIEKLKSELENVKS